jgi:hypothetical protein
VSAVKFVPGIFFRYERYYLYKHTSEKLTEADFLPAINNTSVYFISSNDEADELAMKLPDFRGYSLYSVERLDKGAIACCVFVVQEFAHMGWIAFGNAAQEAINPYPFPVNFADREASTGSAYTVKKYEGKGLLTYGYYRRYMYLRERGVETVWNVVGTGNSAAQRVEMKFCPVIYARAYYIKAFCFKYWKQTPL